jgi:hypothetical protein
VRFENLLVGTALPAIHGPCEVAREWRKVKPGHGNALRVIRHGETARGDLRVASIPAGDSDSVPLACTSSIQHERHLQVDTV